MSKYDILWSDLREKFENNSLTKLCLEFTEIETLLGFPIDHSFLTYKKELIPFGLRVAKISLKEKTVLFEKINLKEV